MREPGFLPEIGTLAGHLEVAPGDLEIFCCGGCGGAESVVGVVGVEEVVDDGSGLEQCNTRIRILERGKSAIRVDRDKRFLLQDAEIEEFLMIWNAEFFKNDGDFPWVGALDVAV